MDAPLRGCSASAQTRAVRQGRLGSPRRWLALCLLVLGAITRAHAAPVAVSAGDPAILLGDRVEVLAETAERFDFEAVLAGRHADAALTGLQSPPNLGYPRHPYWALIELRNDSETGFDRLLVLWRGSTHRQEALVTQLLDHRPPPPWRFTNAAEDVRSRHSVIRLWLPPQSTTRIAVRISTHTALSIDYRLLSEAQLAEIDRVDYGSFGLLVGIVLAIGIYVLALYFALRERIYLLFAVFSLGNILYQIHSEGYAYLLWPEPWRSGGNLLGTFSGTVFAMALVQFIREYMSLKQLVPRLDRWLLVPTLWLVASVFVTYPFLPWLGNTLAAIGVISATLVATLVALVGARTGRPVWSFLLATIAFFAFGVIHLFKRLGMLEDLQSTSLVLQIGSAGTTMAFAIAVMVKVRRMFEERREAQLRHADELEHKVSERTAQLRESKEAAERALQQLRTTQRQLLEADKMASLGQLVAGVSHEVNTPLGIAVTASSHLTERSRLLQRRVAENALSRSELDEYLRDAREAGTMIERNLERAAQLIRSFKQVSVDRTSDGRRRFDLATMIAELIDSLRVTWKRRPISLDVECADGIELDSFPGALGQVLTNLIQNALLHAFAPEQPGHMRIRATRAADEAVELEFSDDGDGLDAPTLARIFDPFFTTKRNQGGTGLGLNIVYNLVVQKLGGSIEASSEPGQGLTLRMRLPLSAPQSAAK